MRQVVRTLLAGTLASVVWGGVGSVLVVLGSGCDLGPADDNRNPPPTSQYYPPPTVNGGGGNPDASNPVTDGGVRITDFYISISSLTFAPTHLSVTPGSTIHVQNLDGFPHTVTSTTSGDVFISGEVKGISFNTGPITANTSFIIPADAPSGTVVPYFCEVHKAMMVNRPTIDIQ